MAICTCGNEIPRSIKIDGTRRNLQNRKLCLRCLPFGQKPKWMPSKRWQQVPNIIKQCHSISDVMLAVGLSDRGNNNATAKKVIQYYNLDISHFYRKKRGDFDYNKVFCMNSSASSSTIRNLYVKFTEYKCIECGCDSWNHKPITLQIDHKNGDRNDNRIENLRYLCPNCHSQTENWGKKTKEYAPILRQEEKQQRVCLMCKCILQKNMTYCSPECVFLSKRKVNRPTKEELMELVQNNSFRSLAIKFGVSDRSIRKWCNYYDMTVVKTYNGKTLHSD